MFNLANMRTELSRKIGPLPLGAWLAIAAVGVAGVIVIRRRLSAAPPAVEQSATVDPASANPETVVTGGFVVGGGPTGSTGGTGSNVIDLFPSTGTAPTTNDDWQIAATRVLLARGLSGTAIADAMSRLFSGMPVTTQQRAMIDIAYAQIGPPPAPIPPVTTEDTGSPETSIPGTHPDVIANPDVGTLHYGLNPSTGVYEYYAVN